MRLSNGGSKDYGPPFLFVDHLTEIILIPGNIVLVYLERALD